MFQQKKVVVVMPAYNAARTLKRTYDEVMAQGIVDLVIVVDDASRDETTAVARTLPHTVVHVHPVNSRLRRQPEDLLSRWPWRPGADIVIMVHPDYQYTPRLIPAMAAMIGTGLYPCVLASRFWAACALKGGMPLWKYFSNRFLTWPRTLILGTKLSEYHTGYRAFSRQLLERLHFEAAPTISFSTTRCSPRSSGWARSSPRSAAPRATRTILVDQLPAERGLRPGLPADGAEFPPGQAGPDSVEIVSQGGEESTQSPLP